jgi:hypothetical protein
MPLILYFRHLYPAAPLVAQHPPRIGHPNKRVLLDIACAPEVPHGGTLEVTRWAPLPLPDTLSLGDLGTLLEARGDLYEYQPVVPGAVEWHLNFADPALFVAYDSPLFAQDELQVAEHSALGSLREALEAEGVDARAVTREGPTPVLIKGVERRCAVDTSPDAARTRCAPPPAPACPPPSATSSPSPPHGPAGGGAAAVHESAGALAAREYPWGVSDGN